MRKAAAQSSISCANVLPCSAVAAALLWLDVFAHCSVSTPAADSSAISSYSSGLNMSSMDAKSSRIREGYGSSDPFMQLSFSSSLPTPVQAGVGSLSLKDK